jgi:hypothetical protein
MLNSIVRAKQQLAAALFPTRSRLSRSFSGARIQTILFSVDRSSQCNKSRSKRITVALKIILASSLDLAANCR